MYRIIFKVMLFMSNYDIVFDSQGAFRELYIKGRSQASLEFKLAYKGHVMPPEIVYLI